MRPKRRITIIDRDDFRLSSLRLMLTAAGFKVNGFGILCDTSFLRYPNADLVICYDLLDARTLVTLADVPVVHLFQGLPPTHCQALTVPANLSRGDLLSRIRVFTQRKRAPRKTVAAARTKRANRG